MQLYTLNMNKGEKKRKKKKKSLYLNEYKKISIQKLPIFE